MAGQASDCSPIPRARMTYCCKGGSCSTLRDSPRPAGRRGLCSSISRRQRLGFCLCMPERCWKSGRQAFDPSEQVCDNCDSDTSRWIHIDSQPLSDRLRYSILHGLTSILVRLKSHEEYNIGAAAFELVFSPGCPVVLANKDSSDSEVDTEVQSVKRVLVIRSMKSK